MVKNHLKRLYVSKSIVLRRKGLTFVTRPKPGQSSLNLGLSLAVLLRDFLKLANNMKEVKYILTTHEVLVDGRRRKDPHFITGFMDTLSLSHIKVYYRMLLS